MAIVVKKQIIIQIRKGGLLLKHMEGFNKGTGMKSQDTPSYFSIM
jgi:hypothetical protein